MVEIQALQLANEGYEIMEVLAVIPARGGSVRTPKKNIKMLGGKPLIAYAIEAAQQSDYVNQIWVSTDSEEIAHVAHKYNALTTLRPPHLRGDCPTEDVVLDLITPWHGANPDIVVCLEPPQPFRTAKHIDDCIYSLLQDRTIDSAVTINKVKSRPEWMVRLREDMSISPYIKYFKPQGRALLRFPASQDFEELYETNGIVFACRTKALLKYGSLVGKNCIGIVTSREDAFDLDYPEDFEICEMIMERRSRAK